MKKENNIFSKLSLSSMGVFTTIITVKSTEKLQSFRDTFFHLTLLAINTGSRSQRTSFNSGDHLAVKRPVTITSSASKKELKFLITKIQQQILHLWIHHTLYNLGNTYATVTQKIAILQDWANFKNLFYIQAVLRRSPNNLY